MTEKRDSTDVLLWLGGAVFAGVAVTWLVVSQPWSGSETLAPLATPTPRAAGAPDAAPEAADPRSEDAQLAGETDAATASGGAKEALDTGLDGTLDSPLRMAALAVKAGMLLEPEGYSAWSLYQQAVRAEPDNKDAREGLQDVADILINRAAVAMEQARIADATRLIETVRAVLPEHVQARRLAAELKMGERGSQPPPVPAQVAAAEPPPKPQATSPAQRSQPKPQLDKPELAPAPAPKLAKVEPAPQPAPRPRDGFADAAEAFDAALAAGRLLAPEDASARHYFLQMDALKPADPRTAAARKTLTALLLARADEAIDAVDTVGADVWLTQAEELGADQLLTEAARLQLDQRIIARDAARPIPVSELTLLRYVPPRYPSRAVDRDIEGWVDVEFTVGKEGQPRDITIVDASHERYFRKEAVNAVTEWEFEPHVLRGATVEQRTFARIAFKLQ